MMFKQKQTKPPSSGEWILTRLKEYSDLGSLGDLEEEYNSIVKTENKFKANFWYWKQVMFALPGYITLLIERRLQMLRHYIKISFRNILKNKSSSFINIFGLSVSLSIGFLILQILFVFYSYDDFHINKERIYRVTSEVSTTERTVEYASTPFPLAKVLLDESPAIEKLTRFKKMNGFTVEKNNTKFDTRLMFADPEFFEIFDYELQYGSPGVSLLSPNSIVLTHELSKKLFGREDPTGKTLRITDIGELTVTGVFKEFTEIKSHISLFPMIPTELLSTFERNNQATPSMNNWVNYRRQYTYFILNENSSVDGIQTIIDQQSAKHFRNPEHKVNFKVQALLDIIPGNSLNDNTGSNLPYEPIYIVIGFALIILLVAGFNYTNLSIARAVTRVKEVGVRKVLGAKKQQLFNQFIGEAVVISVISFFAAYLFYSVFWKTGIANFDPIFKAIFTFDDSFTVIAMFLGFAILTGICAGYLPAKYISKMSVTGVFRSSSNMKIFSGITLRKILITTQFTFTLVFIISTIIAYQQYEYIKRIDIGFETENIINVDLRGGDLQLIRQKFAQESIIADISACDHLPGIGRPNYIYLINPSKNDSTGVYSYSIDDHFINNLEIKLLAGQNFTGEDVSKNGKSILLNELATKRMGFKFPAEAIGATLLLRDKAMEVIGVVKDFSKASGSDAIVPVVLQNSPEFFGNISISFQGGNIFENAKLIETVWKDIYEDIPFTYTVYSESMELQDLGASIIFKSIRAVSICAIMIALLGLIGIVDYSMKVKIKEIGIRKVLGAKTSDIMKLLSKEFIYLLLLSITFAVPLAYILNSLFIEIYTRHIPMKPEFFIMGSIAMLFLGLLSVLSQTYSTAQSNPVDSLKNE